METIKNPPMKSKIILLGLNRSGTKLASFMIAQALGLSSIHLEPFYWEGGIDTLGAEHWENQRAKRIPSTRGMSEHARLPVYCNEGARSPWLREVLCEQAWDVVKFVEIGRCRLYHSINPNALIVGLIRNPIRVLGSLAGARIQRDYIIDQWHRLKQELGLSDPLPGAEQFLSSDLADCARLYKVLYERLGQDMPAGSIRIAYENLPNNVDWLRAVAERTHRRIITEPIEMAQLGLSTQKQLAENASRFVEANLMPIYSSFLGGAEPLGSR